MAVPNRDEVRDFLTTRRAKVLPDQIEMPTGNNRRVPGLRRAEVALLAGVSIEYYTRMERGNLAGVSEPVLDAVACALRLGGAERDPYDKDLQDLIGELSTRSEDFRTKWGRHDVRRHASGEKHFNHPVVGRLDLIFESADLTTDPGWKLLIYSAEPATPAVDALALLATWAATEARSTSESAAERALG